jgi:hypothetical protein
MKAYTWHNVLYDYSAGAITVLANDLAQARQLAVAWYAEREHYGYADDLYSIMQTEPEVQELVAGVLQYHTGSA